MYPRCYRPEAWKRRNRPATSWMHYTTSCKHSLGLLKMGEIIARNMLSWLDLLINRHLLHLVGCLYYLAWISPIKWTWSGWYAWGGLDPKISCLLLNQVFTHDYFSHYTKVITLFLWVVIASTLLYGYQLFGKTTSSFRFEVKWVRHGHVKWD
jgi:hypothetical protein